MKRSGKGIGKWAGLAVGLAGLQACAAGAAAGGGGPDGPPPLRLAEDGRALQEIVIAPGASGEITNAAAYLAAKLEMITGAKFAIATGDGTRGIVLGTLAQFPVEALQQPLAIRPPYKGLEFHDGVEAYGIRTEAGRLLLLGGGDAGVSHAAARFLHRLGYRRFYPAKEWEIAPSTPNLTFSGNETGRPFFLYRNLYGFSRDPGVLGEWSRQQRLGWGFVVQCSQYAYRVILDENKDAFAAHPEYNAVLKGKRLPGTLCLSEPAVRAMAVKHALDYFARQPGADMCTMESPDGAAFCECERCQALGDASARVFGLANEAARAVREKYPGKMLGMLAYYDHTVPPPFPLEPNIHVQLAVRIYNKSHIPVRELIDLWAKKTWNLGDYDYVSLYFFGQDRLRDKAAAMPTANLELLRGDIAAMARNNFRSFYSECGRNWGAHGRGYLVLAALLWDPQTDVDALLADFYDKAFGPAAPAMKRYFDRVDGQNEAFTKALLGLAFRDVDEAARLAKARPDVEARLDHLKQFLSYNYLTHRMSASTNKVEKKELTLKWLTQQFRMRDAYMTSWGMVKAHTVPSLAKTFAEPSWVQHGGMWKEIGKWKAAVRSAKPGETVAPPAVPPWMAPASAVPDPALPGFEYVRPQDMYPPYTRAELEQLFQEGLKFCASSSEGFAGP